jgi:hypothetical protein
MRITQNPMRAAGLATLLCFAAGCGEQSNESAAKIDGQAATTGVNGAAAPAKTQAEYAQQYNSTGGQMYQGQGYPGAR